MWKLPILTYRVYRHTLETYHPQKHYKSSDSHPDCLWSIAPSMIISNHFTKGHFHRHRHLPNNITVLPSLCCRNISRPPGLLQVVHLLLRRNISYAISSNYVQRNNVLNAWSIMQKELYFGSEDGSKRKFFFPKGIYKPKWSFKLFQSLWTCKSSFLFNTIIPRGLGKFDNISLYGCTMYFVICT